MLAAYFVLLEGTSGVPENPGHTELPMAPEAYGLIALAVFAVLLLITWAFRSTGSRH